MPLNKLTKTSTTLVDQIEKYSTPHTKITLFHTIKYTFFFFFFFFSHHSKPLTCART